MVLTEGDLLDGRYQLGPLRAAGGMGEVWAGCDVLLERAVAIKIPRPEYAADPAFQQRFQIEAKHAAALAHPHVATVFDFGSAAGVPYLVMELIEGTSLADRLAADGAMEADEVRRLVQEVASALAAAHRAGVCHRDIKPGNLLLRRDGGVVVTDFGVARAVDAAAVTETGSIVGTAYYVSPEQIRGEPALPASDLYALGVVAHECLTGSRPFDGELLAVLHGHRSQAPAPLPASVPADLAATVSALLSKEPADRPSAADLCASSTTGAVTAAGTPARLRPQSPAALRPRDAAARRPTGIAARVGAPALAPPADAGGARTALETSGVMMAQTRALPREPLPPAAPAGLPPAPAVRLRRHPRPWLVGAGGLATLLLAGTVAIATMTASGRGTPRPVGPPVQGVSHPAMLHPVPVVAAALYHPGGTDQDHPGDIGLAYDGNPSTAWRTQHYATSTFGGLRPGVGLIFDLGRPIAVRRLDVTLTSAGTSIEVHPGQNLTSPTILRTTASTANLTTRPPHGVASRFWLVWISRLPASGQAGVAEVRFAA